MESDQKRQFYKKCFFDELVEELFEVLDVVSTIDKDGEILLSQNFYKEMMRIAVERKSVFWDMEIKPYSNPKEGD